MKLPFGRKSEVMAMVLGPGAAVSFQKVQRGPGFWKVGKHWIHASTTFVSAQTDTRVVVMRDGETKSIWDSPVHVEDLDVYKDSYMWAGTASVKDRYNVQDWFILAFGAIFGLMLVGLSLVG